MPPLPNIQTRTVGNEQLGPNCPAAIEIHPDGHATLLIHRQLFHRLPPQQQRFIIAHELGHLLLDTNNETLADAFALGLTAGRQHQSLKHSLRALASIPTIPLHRLQHLYSLCRTIDQQPTTH